MVLSDDVRYQSGEKVTAQFFSGNVMENGWAMMSTNPELTTPSVTCCISKQGGENSKIIGTVDYFNAFTLKANLGVSRQDSSCRYVFWYSK